jgi:hypothetical protein
LLNIHSAVKCICKILKSYCYLYHGCSLGLTQLPHDIFPCNICFNLLRSSKSHYSQATISGTLYEERYTGLIVSRSFLLTMWNNSEKFVEKFKTKILLLIFFSYYCWDNIAKYSTGGQVTAVCTCSCRCVHVVCRIIIATNTNSHYALFIAVLQHHWLHKCTSLSHDMYIVWLGVKIEWAERQMGVKYLFIVR